MTFARTLAVALFGVEGRLVEVEADLAQGLPGLTIVGLPDTALHEARDRIRAAIVNSGEAWPQRRITLGLSPASLPKRGSGFDLAMATAVLAAASGIPPSALHGTVFVGELGLDGRVRPVRGVLPAVLAAVGAKAARVVVANENRAEAGLVPDVEVVGVATLGEVLAFLRCGQIPASMTPPMATGAAEPRGGSPDPPSSQPPQNWSGFAGLDLADVVGQPAGRSAVEVAAAGGHHLLLMGDPGAGKTMLAERLPGLLPDLAREAALEVTVVHSVAGALPQGSPLVTRPPFENPHHTASVAALVGGGSGLARPGAVSLAHRGVLFLDEAPEFSTGVLDALRQPMESGCVRIARSAGTTSFPARFALVLAANPCPCGAPSGPSGGCICTPSAKRRYLSRVSGPLLDRIDLQIVVSAVTRMEMLADRGNVEPSRRVAERVGLARDRAAVRLAGSPWRTNAEIPGPELRRRWPAPRDGLAQVEKAVAAGTLSARGMDRVLRIAWTLADLAGHARPGAEEVDRALGLRMRRVV